MAELTPIESGQLEVIPPRRRQDITAYIEILRNQVSGLQKQAQQLRLSSNSTGTADALDRTIAEYTKIISDKESELSHIPETIIQMPKPSPRKEAFRISKETGELEFGRALRVESGNALLMHGAQERIDELQKLIKKFSKQPGSENLINIYRERIAAIKSEHDKFAHTAMLGQSKKYIDEK
jgi:hypothetical protein